MLGVEKKRRRSAYSWAGRDFLITKGWFGQLLNNGGGS
jgi:hypothetical protein